MCLQILVYPLEITKTRLALSTTGEYTSVFDVVATIVRDGGDAIASHHADSTSRADASRVVWRVAGLRGLYRGIVPSVLGIIPYAGTRPSL